jgi:hypothetical protein
MSNDEIEKEMKEFLKQAFGPVKNSELRRDLWPQMLEKLSRQPIHVPWFDWVLAGLAGAALLFFPGIIPALFYHL